VVALTIVGLRHGGNGCGLWGTIHEGGGRSHSFGDEDGLDQLSELGSLRNQDGIRSSDGRLATGMEGARRYIKLHIIVAFGVIDTLFTCLMFGTCMTGLGGGVLLCFNEPGTANCYLLFGVSHVLLSLDLLLIV